MELRILAAGRLKDSALHDHAGIYIERSRQLLPISLVTVKDLATLRRRAERPSVVLDERGELIDSLALSRWIGAWRDSGRPRVDFLVGDSHGFDEVDRQRADRVLALSRLTLPHRLALLVLIEQLYRAGTILFGHPYHHA